MQKILTDGKKPSGATKRIKGLYKKKESKKQRYNKKVQKQKIEQYLEESKTVKQIYNMLKNNGTSLKSIAKLKSSYIKRNPKKQQEYQKLEEDAIALLKGGYTPSEVYEIMEYDVPSTRLIELNKLLKDKEKGIEI